MDEAGEYRYWLEKMRKFKPYTLSEPEEKIINSKNSTESSALRQIYSMITNRYSYNLTIDGKSKKVTRGELTSLVFNPDPDIRAMAYKELYRIFGEDNEILGQIYQSLILGNINENVDLRNFSHPISHFNLTNDIPDDIVDTLLETAKKNTHVFQKFFKLKAKRLKMSKLRRYDIYAPVSNIEREYDYNSAVKIVLETFQNFNPEIANLTNKILDENHIDSEVREGKAGGAFCSYADPKETPFVLLSFNNKISDVETLGHELGHAIHGLL